MIVRRTISAIRRHAGGTALVEFAIVLPVVLTLYYGSIMLQNGLSCSRKVTIATRALADLTAQNMNGTTTAAEMDNALSATALVLAPFKASAASMRVTEVMTDANQKTTVQWSRANDGTALARNTVVTIPSAMRISGTYFLLAQVTYQYEPPAFLGKISPYTFTDEIYMLPRNSNRIDCADC